jgi:hypothetical protein
VESDHDDYKERLTLLVELRDPNEVASSLSASKSRHVASPKKWSSRLALNILSMIGSMPSARRCTSRVVQRMLSGRIWSTKNASSSSSSLSATNDCGYTVTQLDEISNIIRRSVLTTFGIGVSDLVLVRARCIKKTSR